MELDEAKRILGMIAGRKSGVTTVTLNRDAARVVLDYLEAQGEPSDAALDAAFAAFRAHERSEEFNEFGEHVCSECGYAYSWPSGVDGRQEVPARRRQRHIAREALRAASQAKGAES